MKCALVDIASAEVTNLIVADPAVDQAPEGFVLIPSPPGFVKIGTPWNGYVFIDTSQVEGLTTPAPVDGLEML